MSPREVRCTCGAINDVGFGTCIRCGETLGREGAKPVPRQAPRRPTVETDRPSFGKAALLLGGLCAVVFALQLSWAMKSGDVRLLGGSGSLEDDLRAGVLVPGIPYVLAQPYRLVSYMFAHYGLLHFGMNMMAFVSLSRNAEALVGTSRTIIAFVLTGVAGGLATVGWQTFEGGGIIPTAGASGGILGVMGLLLGVLLRRRDPAWKNLAIHTLFYAVLFGFAVNASNAGIMINNAAHLGGLFTGLALGLLWYRHGATESPGSRIAGHVLFGLCVLCVMLALKSGGQLAI